MKHLIIKPEELEKKIKSEEIDSLYLLYGEETYLMETNLKKIKKNFGECINGINYILLDENNVRTLISEIEVPAFGYDRKLIIIKDSGLFKKKTAKTQEIDLEEYIDKIKESCIVIFVEQEVEKNDLFKLIEKNGTVCNFERLKPATIAKRLKAICSAYKVNVDDDTLSYLAQNIGTDMQIAINEIRKLIEHAGENGTIQKEDIDNLCIKQTEAVIFDLTDYLGNKNTKEALNTLNNLIYNKEPVQRLLILIYNHFKKVYLTKLAEKLNKNIAESLSLKPNQMFLTSKYKKQAGYFTEKTLREILQALINLDADSKLGQIDLQTGLEAILCNYCN